MLRDDVQTFKIPPLLSVHFLYASFLYFSSPKSFLLSQIGFLPSSLLDDQTQPSDHRIFWFSSRDTENLSMASCWSSTQPGSCFYTECNFLSSSVLILLQQSTLVHLFLLCYYTKCLWFPSSHNQYKNFLFILLKVLCVNV